MHACIVCTCMQRTMLYGVDLWCHQASWATTSASLWSWRSWRRPTLGSCSHLLLRGSSLSCENAGNVKYSKCVEIEYGQPLVKTRIPSWKDSQRICNNEQSISFSKSFAAPGCRLVARASIMSTRCSGRAAQSDQAIIFHQSLDWLEWKMMQILWIFLLLSWYFWMFQCLMPNLLR